MNQRMGTRPSIAHAQADIEASPDEVWGLLTQRGPDPDIMFGAEVVSDWQVGSPIRWKGEWEGKRFEDKGEVIEVDPPRRLVVTHFSPMSGDDDGPENYHLVSYSLDATDGGTRVTFDVDNERCTGRFARRENGKEASWDLRRDRKAGFSLMMRCRPLS